MARKNVTGWSREFGEPISVPKGEPLITLRDASEYIRKPTKKRKAEERWQTAAQALATRGQRQRHAVAFRDRHAPSLKPRHEVMEGSRYRLVRSQRTLRADAR
jgi:hypothetical protein